MNKIWYTMWEVMFACVKNEAPHATTLNLVERFVNRTYNEAIEELKEQELIDEETEEQAKEQSNIDKMAREMQVVENVQKGFAIGLKRFCLAILLGAITMFLVMKFKLVGIVGVLTFLLVYHFLPSKSE